MEILIPKVNMKARLNRLWAKVRNTWVAEYVTHEAQGDCALSLLKQFSNSEKREIGRLLASGLFGRPLMGAGYAWNGRYPLGVEPGATIPVVTTGANVANFTVMDYCSVFEIGLIWQVAGTVTALVMDFDKYTGPTAVGTLTDKLDGTNGVITAPTVAGQAIGNVLHRNIGQTLAIDLDKGNSVQAIVTTTTTAGSGVPFILVSPRDETNANKTTLIATS